jgi:hypothetical protein
MDAAVIDRLVENPQCLLRAVEEGYMPVQFSLSAHILPAIFVELLPALGIVEPKDGLGVFTFARASRLGHLQHDTVASHVFLYRQLKCTRCTIETAGKSAR